MTQRNMFGAADRIYFDGILCGRPVKIRRLTPVMHLRNVKRNVNGKEGAYLAGAPYTCCLLPAVIHVWSAKRYVNFKR